jgi:hypothetical protein
LRCSQSHIAVFGSHDFKTCDLFIAAIFEDHVIMLRAFKLRVSKTAERSAASHPHTAAQRHLRRKQLMATTRITLHQIRLNIIRLCAPSLGDWLNFVHLVVYLYLHFAFKRQLWHSLRKTISQIRRSVAQSEIFFLVFDVYFCRP